ncbi:MULTISPECIES: CBO0543 family protein [unclassified Bacillus (in: firmicutes)]|uniref:CBO0543 family protein n=1 Tax=unclassified Bacillus (in: firmicutes) TaxID=185979 RepID=UPI0008E73CF3|nr:MULTISPECIES: CBO0543 family protein [unclassified Bacillus (in: firmicutes)]SFB06565.1 hypothetical protein SAMN02799634_10527 [Bacillus sp. UNCCL13]SFQ87641.1 hypothetical protein SAMN04488577_3091 [Bacillus sp. cl95]
MVALVYSILWILAAWKWGDWKNWSKYYPTILFASIGNLIYEVVCSEYPMWLMEPNGLPNRTLPILLLVIVGMPLSVFLYLSYYPFKKSKTKQAMHIFLFVAIFVVLEYASVKLGSITYHNGWNLYWSTLFNIVMFSILRLHHTHYRFALILSAIFIGMLSIMFDLTLGKMR